MCVGTSILLFRDDDADDEDIREVASCTIAVTDGDSDIVGSDCLLLSFSLFFPEDIF